MKRDIDSVWMTDLAPRLLGSSCAYTVTGSSVATDSAHTATMTIRAMNGVRQPFRDEMGQHTATHRSALIAVNVNAPATVLVEVTMKYSCTRYIHTNVRKGKGKGHLI